MAIRVRSSQQGFNPPPVRKPEETSRDMPQPEGIRFQSAPSSQTGGNMTPLSSAIRHRTSFNPPPVRKPEETVAVTKRRALGDCFNPPPVRKPEETPAASCWLAPRIEFQSAPSSQTGGNSACSPSPWPCLACFNPPPVRKPEETPRTNSDRRTSKRFNPPPVRKPEETVDAPALPPRSQCFNPPPVRKPEETWTDPLDPLEEKQFQSAPSSQTGGNYHVYPVAGNGICFNPPPVRKPEETQAGRALCLPCFGFQSAPSSQTGGNSPTASRDVPLPTSFNPPPVRKPEETNRHAGVSHVQNVSIRPQFANRRKQRNRMSDRFDPVVSIRPQFANRRKLEYVADRYVAYWFQSAPSSQTGGNSAEALARALARVSIRPQFANRRKQCRPRSGDGSLSSFNPPPVRKPEET